MKKMMAFVTAAIVFVVSGAFSVSAATAEAVVIDKSRVADGVISVTCTNKAEKKIKVRVEKDGTYYDYNLLKANETIDLPLQLGIGKYKITVAENVSGTRYLVLKTETITVEQFDEKKVFTNSIQMVNFNGKMISIVELNKLVAELKTDREKVDKIYQFIVDYFGYDFDKINKVLANAAYLPIIDITYADKKGVCYDFASLFAAILRANNIPAKLDMGYFKLVGDAYHAWNEVLVDGEWVFIDTTYDAQAKQYKMVFEMKKDVADFKIVKQY